MNFFEEVAAVVHPLPQAEDYPDDGILNDVRGEVDGERRDEAEALQLAWEESEEGEGDPVLSALMHAARRREQIEEEIRRLLAYGREFVWPRPYTLASLADAAGMSISGARTAYDQRHIAAVKAELGRRPDQPPLGGRSARETDQ